MTSNRPPRKVRTESDVMKMHYASLSRARKANQMEDRRHAMRVEDELTSATNYELATMERERRRIQRDLAALKLNSNKEAIRRRQEAIAREVTRQQEIRNSLVHSPLPVFDKEVGVEGADFLFADSHLMRKEHRGRRKSSAPGELRLPPTDRLQETPPAEHPAVIKKIATTNVPAPPEKSPTDAEKKRKRPTPLPSFKERMSEARKARYIRSKDPVVVHRERELTAAEIFGSK